MPLSKSEADEALALVSASATHSAQLARYDRAGSQVILWGAIWMLAYGIEFLGGRGTDWIWAVLGPLGFVASVLLARRQSGSSNWRIGVAIWTIFLFVVAVLTVLGPPTPEQIAAVNALVVATAYIIFGLMLGPRFILIGIFQAVSTLIGYFVFPGLFIGWMSLLGGGSLILAGFWLRKA